MESFYDFEIWEASMATRITLVTSCGVMTLVGILGNICILILVAMVKSLRTTVNKSLAALSLADTIYLMYQPVVTMNWEFGKDDSNLGANLCYFILFYDKGGVLCSCLIFLFVSVDRYIAICHPLVSLYYWSGRRTVYALASISVATAALSFPTYLMSSYDSFVEGNETLVFCYHKISEPWMKVYVTVLEVISNFAIIPLLIFLYGSMVWALTKEKPGQETARANHAQKMRAARKRTIVMLLIAVSVFVVCRFPRGLLEIFNMHARYIYAMSEALVDRDTYIVYWISWILLFINCQANPFIIFTMSSSFRKAFVDVFCACRKSKKSSANTRVGLHVGLPSNPHQSIDTISGLVSSNGKSELPQSCGRNQTPGM